MLSAISLTPSRTKFDHQGTRCVILDFFSRVHVSIIICTLILTTRGIDTSFRYGVSCCIHLYKPIQLIQLYKAIHCIRCITTPQVDAKGETRLLPSRTPAVSGSRGGRATRFLPINLNTIRGETRLLELVCSKKGKNQGKRRCRPGAIGLLPESTCARKSGKNRVIFSSNREQPGCSRVLPGSNRPFRGEKGPFSLSVNTARGSVCVEPSSHRERTIITPSCGH